MSHFVVVYNFVVCGSILDLFVDSCIHVFMFKTDIMVACTKMLSQFNSWRSYE